MKTLLFAFVFCVSLFQTTAKLKQDDLNGLIGKTWAGTLTYLDYGTNKLVPIPTELTVTNSPKGPGVYNWLTAYPKEPSHNSTDEITISSDGGTIDGETVKERELMANGTLKFVTVKQGTDNNKKATFRYTYLIGKTTFSRKKEVCFDATDTWFTRNSLAVSAKN